MLHLSQEDIAYLRPSTDANSIQHSSSYIKSGSESDSQRSIFYGVDLDNYELHQIEDFKHELQHSGVSLNASWGDRELLKYLYAVKFNTKKAVENLKESLRWRTEVQLLPVSDRTLEVLHSGVIYTFGRDNQSRPIIVINLSKLDSKIVDKNEASIVLSFYLDSLKQHSFLQGKVENLIIIIDAADKEFDGFPFEKFDTLIKRVVISHPTLIEKVYVLNANSSVRTLFNAARDFIDQGAFDKVQLVSSTELYKLQEKISSNQLETKYGGSAPNVACFWPVSSISPHGSLATYTYEAPAQTHERYTSSGIYGTTSHFDFDTTEHKKIYERTTMALPTSDYTYRYSAEPEHHVRSVHVTEYNYTVHEPEQVVKSSVPVETPHEECTPVENNETRYDFNDDALLELVAEENEFMKHSKHESPIKYHTDTYTAKHLVDSSHLYPNSASTSYQVEVVKKSSVYQEVGRDSHRLEEWNVKKYLKNQDDDEDDEEPRIEFCGLCVSNRRVQKH